MRAEWQFDFKGYHASPYQDLKRISFGTLPSITDDIAMPPQAVADRAEIRRLFRSLDGLVSMIAKEEIECKLKGKRTERHVMLTKDFNALYDHINQMATMFKLRYL